MAKTKSKSKKSKKAAVRRTRRIVREPEDSRILRRAPEDESPALPVIVRGMEGPSDSALIAAHELGCEFRAACISQAHERVSATMEFNFSRFREIRYGVRHTEGNGTYNGALERPLWRAFLAGICAEPLAR